MNMAQRAEVIGQIRVKMSAFRDSGGREKEGLSPSIQPSLHSPAFPLAGISCSLVSCHDFGNLPATPVIFSLCPARYQPQVGAHYPYADSSCLELYFNELRVLGSARPKRSINGMSDLWWACRDLTYEGREFFHQACHHNHDVCE